MNITVFGANGNIGRRVVSLLLNEDHHVTAFVYGSLNLKEHERLTIINGDVKNSEDVAKALTDADAVISTLGSWGTESKDILSSGMKVIIPAMEKAHIKRIISLTGSGVLLRSDTVAWYDRLNPALLNLIAPKILTDGEKHIQELSKSNLDWIVVRSPVMKDSERDTYTLSSTPPLPWKRMSRNGVARAIVDLVTNDQYLKQSPFIS